MENRIAGAKMTHYYCPPKKSSDSSDETHNHRHDRPTDMPMVVSFSAAFRGEYGEKYRQYVAWLSCLSCHSACDNGISCANKRWNLTFAGLCLNSKALSETVCRILHFISYNLCFAISPLSFNRKCDILWSVTEGG